MANLLQNGMNVGTDASVTFLCSNGTTFRAEDIGNLTDFNFTFKDTPITCRPISNQGQPIVEVVPHECDAKMTFTRFNSFVTDIYLNYRTQWFLGNRISYTIQVVVRNRDGGVDTYLFTGCKPTGGGFGDFRAEKAVDQPLNWICANVTKNGGASLMPT
jgi:hypothetical protein